MTPFYFGTRQRRLFGVYEPPHRPRGRAALLCHPWGAEYLSAHRSVRQLAAMLSASGYHTLRFDYYGAGDSGGDTTDGDWNSHVSDIGAAMDELRGISGARRITLIGLRLGASLAAAAATEAPDEVDALVLWDPVVFGRDYLAEFGVTTPPEVIITGTDHASASRFGHEVDGFPLTVEMESGIADVDLVAMMPLLTSRTLVVAHGPQPSHLALQSALDARTGPPVVIEYIAGRPAWTEWPLGHVNAGTVPVNTLQRIVEWLE